MRRIDGHVCQPLVEWIRKEAEAMPKGWGGRERCLPAKEEQIETMRNQMLGIHRHIRRRILQGAIKSKKPIKAEWANEGWLDGVEAMIKEDRWGDLWERWARSRPSAMEESSLKRFKQEFKKVVVCHVDKHSSEGMLI